MLEGIEETLRQLRLTMESHRRSLAASGSRAAVQDLLAPEFRMPEPNLQPSGRLAEICTEIERVAGVQISEAISAKLERLFASSSDAALAEWVQRVRRPGPLHPDLQLLIESLTTHETYLFRDPLQLDLLRNEMLPALIAAARADGRRRLRLWSAGCATGEEAYSLAVVALTALLDAGEAFTSGGRITPTAGWRVEVLGTDISGRAVDAAAEGLYSTAGLSSFRETPPALLPYFPEAADGKGRYVCDELKRIVRFARFNLLERSLPIAECDVVACRNVLIYLTPEAGHRVQHLLHLALRPGGCLLLGRTDSLAEPARYASRWTDGGFIHRRLGEP